MRVLLRTIALLSAAVVIAGCDSGGGGDVADAGQAFPDPQVGLQGTAAKGIISGGDVTVTDASGVELPLRSSTETDDDGGYELVFTEATVAAGLDLPLTVTVTGGTATCDFDEDGTDDDCSDGAGGFVAFGETYDLPADFTLRAGVTATENGVATVNVTAASEVAVRIARRTAGTSPLTVADVNRANAQISGMLGAMTGIDMGSRTLTRIGVVDLTRVDATSGGVPLAQFATAAFSAAILDLIDPADPDADTIAEVMGQVVDSLTEDANGNLAISGTSFGRITRAMANGLQIAANRLGTTTISGLTQAIANARNQADLFDGLGDNEVVIPEPADPQSTEPLDLTQRFVAEMSRVINTTLVVTGADGFGGSAQGVTESLAAELDVTTGLASDTSTMAFNQIDEPLRQAATDAELDGDPVVVGEGDVTFTLAKTSDGTTGDEIITVTNLSSTYTQGEGEEAVSSVLTVSEMGTTSNGFAFTMEGVSLVGSSGGAPVFGFAGEAEGTFNPSDKHTIQTLMLEGDLTGSSGSYGTTIELWDILVDDTDTETANHVDGSYRVELRFQGNATEDLTLTFWGDIGSNAADLEPGVATTSMTNFLFEAGLDAIMGGIYRTGSISGSDPEDYVMDTTRLTDGTVYLTLTVVQDSNGFNVTEGVFTVGEVETGTLNPQTGLVTYSDGSVQALPAIIF